MQKQKGLRAPDSEWPRVASAGEVPRCSHTNPATRLEYRSHEGFLPRLVAGTVQHHSSSRAKRNRALAAEFSMLLFEAKTWACYCRNMQARA